MSQAPHTLPPITKESTGNELPTWEQDVDELLRQITEVDTEKCIVISEGMKIYKRIAAFVYVQLQISCGKAESRDLTPFFTVLTQWSSWDVTQSLCKHDIIRTTLWEFLQMCGAPNQFTTIVGGHSLKQMIHRDEADIRCRFEEIANDPPQKQRLLAESLENPTPLLNLLQMLLDLNAGGIGSNRLLVRTMAWLAKRSGTYPDCLNLTKIRRLGEHPVTGGGFADIWRGEFIDQPVALKAIRIFFNDSPKKKETVFQNFAHEAVVWRQLRHKNILPFYGIFKGNTSFDHLCLVSPWMDAGNIISFLKHSPDSDRISLLGDVIEGLKYLHNFEPTIVQGDLKGSNIFVTPLRTACLADFGLTSFRDPRDSTGDHTTESLRGTIRWQARELLFPDGDGKIARPSRESDIYSFGCVCLEVMTGSVPFSELHEMAVTIAIVHNITPQRPVGMCTVYGLDDSLWNTIEQCWDTEPSQRPSVVQLGLYFDQRRGPPSGESSVHRDFPQIPPATLDKYGFPESYLLKIAQGDLTTYASNNFPVREQLNLGQHKREPQTRNTSVIPTPHGPSGLFEENNFGVYRTQHQQLEKLIFPTDFSFNPPTASARASSGWLTGRQSQAMTGSYGSIGKTPVDGVGTTRGSYLLGSSPAYPSTDSRRVEISRVPSLSIYQQLENPTVPDGRNAASHSLSSPTSTDSVSLMAPTPIIQRANVLRNVSGIADEDGIADIFPRTKRNSVSHFRSARSEVVIRRNSSCCHHCREAKVSCPLGAPCARCVKRGIICSNLANALVEGRGRGPAPEDKKHARSVHIGPKEMWL